jgi:hypothetical protein
MIAWLKWWVEQTTTRIGLGLLAPTIAGWLAGDIDGRHALAAGLVAMVNLICADRGALQDRPQ